MVPTFEKFLSESLGVPAALTEAARSVVKVLWPELERLDRLYTDRESGPSSPFPTPVCPPLMVPLKWWSSDRRAPIERAMVDLSVVRVSRRLPTRFNASFSGLRSASGMDSDGQVAHLSFTLLVWPGEIGGWATSETKTNLQATVQHELLHAHEARMRALHGAGDMGYSAAGVSDLSSSLHSGDIGWLMEDPTMLKLIMAMYHSAPYEVSARVAQAAAFVDAAPPEERAGALRRSHEWSIAMDLLAFDARAMWDTIVSTYGSDKATALVDAVREQLLDRSAWIADRIDSQSWRPDPAHSRRFLAQAPVHARKGAMKAPKDFLLYWEKIARRAGEDNRRRLLRLLAR